MIKRDMFVTIKKSGQRVLVDSVFQHSVCVFMLDAKNKRILLPVPNSDIVRYKTLVIDANKLEV